MNRLLYAAFAFMLPALARAELEFTAYLHADGMDYFLLTDRDAGARSGWLTLGRSFHGLRLAGYDASRFALIVETGGKREALPLRDALVRAGDPTLPHAETAEFGWFAPKQRGRGTTEIPLQLGVTFGIEMTLAGVLPKATVDLELRFHTPPLIHPDGTVTTLTTSRQKARANADGCLPGRNAYFTFEQPWQLVPGIYSAEIIHEGRVIIRQAFNVSATAPHPPSPEGAFLSGR